MQSVMLRGTLIASALVGLALACGDEASSGHETPNGDGDASAGDSSTTLGDGSPLGDAGGGDANASCGWTGHDCLGAACANGKCPDQRVSSACRAGDFDGGGIFPCGENGGWGMAIEGSNVVWLLGTESIGGGALYRAPVDGTADATRLGSSQDGTVSGPRGAAANGTDVIYANLSDSALWTLTGSSTTSLRSVESPAWPQVASGRLYWVGEVYTKIWGLDLPNGDPKLVFDVGGGSYAVPDFAVAGDEVVFANCTSPEACTIAKVPISGGEPTILAQDQRYVGCVGVTGSRAVWSLAPSADQDAIAIHAVSLTGGTVATLGEVKGTSIAGAVLVDGENVFSIDEAGVFRVDGAGQSGSVTRVADPVGGIASRACHQMATDAKYLYFVTARGEVRRVPK